jgi:acyl-CoA reductase-like NAD-dependent aldehyde dehydrogenase
MRREGAMTVAAHWIGSDWLTAGVSDACDSISPADGTLVGKVPHGGRSEAIAAIEAAKTAFQQTAWSRSPRLRAEVLFEAADRIDAEAPRIADLLSRETGKLWKVARLELASTVSELRYYAGLVRAISGRVIEMEPGVYSLLLREPAGVAGIIVPWNAPGILLVRSLAPALAAGCSVVVKPALQSSLFHTEIMACLREVSGLPAGIVNSFCEVGSDGARELVRSADVDVVSFTGSSAVGKTIMAEAAATLKRLNLELGGKAPAIIFEDCDLDAIAPRIAAGAMILCGQQCTAINRILVHESMLDKEKPVFADALRAMKVGRIDRDETQIGPLINAPSRERIERLVEEASSVGRVVLQGRRPEGELAAGSFLTPTLLDVEALDTPFIQEEFFGPVVNIEPFADEVDAVRRANATRYGLSASVWTRDLGRAHRVARAVKTGTVWINEHNRLLPEVETGGRGDSGIGRLHGVEGLNEFLETKHVFQNHGPLRR